MLGQEIIINACVLGYYNQPAGSTQYLYRAVRINIIVLLDYVLIISCTVFEGDFWRKLIIP